MGGLVRTVRARWDVPAGTLAQVDTVGRAGVLQVWCFTVRWHVPPENKRGPRRKHSLNLFAADLDDFELLTEAIPPTPASESPSVSYPPSTSPSPQLGLPSIGEDFISERLGVEGWPLLPEPLQNFGKPP